MIIDGTTIKVQIAPDDTLFTESPTWVDLDGVRDAQVTSSGRTTEIDQAQPGFISLQVSNRDRLVDLAYGPASVAFDGSGSDYWSAGDLAAFSGATELDLRAVLTLPDWTPAAANTFAAQWQATGNQRCWQFDIDTNGYLSLATSSNGTTTTVVNSGYRVSAVDGQTMCVRATWSSSAGDVYFYVKRPVKGRERAACLSHDGWAQIGGVKTGVTAALFNSTAAVTIGDRIGATSQPTTGSVLYADARTTIGSSTLVFAFWPADAASSAATSWVATAGAGETWTKVGSSTITVQGEYYNRVGPGTPVRLLATRSAVDYVVGYGYLRRAPQVFPSFGMDAVAQLTATDTLGWLAEQQAPSTPSQFGTGTGGHFWPLHEDNNVQQAGDAIGGLPGSWSQPRTAGGPTQPGAVTLTSQALIEGTYLTTSEPTSIDMTAGVFLRFSFYLPAENSIFRVLCSDGTRTLGINYGVGGEYYVQGAAAALAATFGDRLSPGMHTFEMYSNGSGSEVSYFDDHASRGLEYTGTRAVVDAPNALYVDGSAASVSDVALFSESSDSSDAYLGANGGTGQTSAARMSALLYGSMGSVPALWTLTSDVSTYLGPTALGVSYGELCRQVNTAEQGRFHQDLDGEVIFRSRLWGMTATAATVSQATFGDGTGEIDYVDISVDPGGREDVINDVTVSLPNGASGHYVDTESVAAFGRRTGSYSAPLTSPADATGLARHIVGLRAWPQVRITNLTINPAGSSDAWTQVLTRKIGDRITVKRRTTDTLSPSVATQPISVDVCIEQISHRITRAGEWRTVYLTTPAPPTASEAGYFTFDDTVLGQFDAGLSFAY